MTTAKQENLSASLEDYLEAIFNLTRHNTVARSKDIAYGLGVARPSVTGALKQLAGKGLINYEPYGFVMLTKAGQAKAAGIAKKHDVIASFFTDILGVDSQSAAEAACRAEHTLGKNIVSRLMSFMDFVSGQQKSGNDLVEKFQEFRGRKNSERQAGQEGQSE